MKILLTGSSGFLGNVLLNFFKSENIITLGRSNTDIVCDLSNEIPFISREVDIVIHCAGIAHFIPLKSLDFNLFYNVNVIGTKNLLNGLYEISTPKQFIFISSVSVYGVNEGNNINENYPLLANDPYGLSKIQAEDIIKEWCIKNNVICTILRLPLIVGFNPPGNLGIMINAIQKNYYFNIAGGNARKSMVLASDIAKFILRAGKIGGTFNLTDGFHPSFYDLSKSISQNLKKKFTPNMPLILANILAKIGDYFGNKFPINTNKLSKITSTLIFDDTKARIAFGWNPSPVLDFFKIQKYDK